METPTVTDPTCPLPTTSAYSDRADDMLGFHVRSVEATRIGVRYHVETADELVGCPSCGTIAKAHNRRRHTVGDIRLIVIES
ncbi:hypothetical protein CIK60_16970, partial [Brevibacterium aurantiacum]